MVLLMAVAAHVIWVWAVDQAHIPVTVDSDESSLVTEAGESPSASEIADDAEKRYREAGHLPRTGITRVRVTPQADERTWHARASHTVTLDASDPMIADLRTNAESFENWKPLVLWTDSTEEGDSYSCAEQSFANPDIPLGLEQKKKADPVRVTRVEEAVWGGDPRECGPQTVLYISVIDDRLGPYGIYGEWTVTIDAPDHALVEVRGATTVISQGAHQLSLLLTERATVVTVVLETDEFPGGPDLSGPAQLAVMLQDSPGPGWNAFWLMAAVAAVTRFWILPFIQEWAPSTTRRRWRIAALAGCAVTGILLLYCLAGDAMVPPWSQWQYDGRATLLVVWLWVLLPFLVAAFTIRAIALRLPTWKELLGLVLPSSLLLAPVAVLCKTGWTLVPLLPIVLAVSAALGVLVVLSKGAWGPVGRRWAATVAAGVLLMVLAAGPGTGLHADEGRSTGSWPVANALTLPALAWGWLSIVWVVLAALQARRKLLWFAVALASLATLTGATGYGWGDTWFSEPGIWFSVDLDSTSVADWFLVNVVFLLIAGVLTYLQRHGRGLERPVWPPHTRTALLGLGLVAAGSGLGVSGFTSFDMVWSSGPYFALVLAALGYSWLMPVSVKDRAVKLHRVRSRVHNHLMHTLLRDQSLLAGRREFLTTARSALAAGELTQKEWKPQWDKLGALGARSNAPQRSAALRRTALSTSGGRSGWRNGLAGSVALMILTLPWSAFTVPPLITDTLDYGTLDQAQAWLYGLRWAVPGFIYGYAYSWLRGSSPLGKALCLLAVVLPIELSQLLQQELEPGEFASSILLTTGNCLAVHLVLGLYWEIRLARAAGLAWGQIRNFRSLSATAVPVTTVLVAAATALATAMVGVWITPETAPVPEESPSVSASPTPIP
ncbi:hypothetical protein OG381_48135 [Streptomyces sp. NBC_00490]|uniref:hypothetical protein n=1 Tax=Streptomyces sp. NBC_00490 TaxID=2903657 RepID=UPI002E17D1DF